MLLRSGATVAALVTLATLVAAWGFAPPFDRAVGEQDDLLFHNFHELRTLGRSTYRWAKGGRRGDDRASTIVLPQVGQGNGGRLELALRSPEGSAVPVKVRVGGHDLLVTGVIGRRTLSVTVPRAALAGGDVRATLTSPAWTTASDPRPRGVGVERVGWRPGRWMFPPWRQIVLVPAAAALLALLAVRVRATSRAARLAPAIAGGALALAAAWRPLEVAPYAHRLVIAALLAHAALALWAALVRTPGQRWFAAPTEAGPASLVLVMGVAYWTVVAIQSAWCMETGALCPARVTAGVALAVAAGLLAAASWRSPRRVQAALAVVLAGAVAQAASSGARAFRRSAVDFSTLWVAAHDSALGGSLYKPADVAANHFGAVFKVPPFYGMLLLPYTRTDVRTALTVHREVEVVLYLFCAAVLFACVRPRLGTAVGAAAVATVFGLMQPAFDSIAYGQIDVILLALVIAAFLALRAGRPALVGLALAVAALLKLYPLVLVAYLAARRQWRAIAWTAGWLVALDLAAVVVMGWGEHLVYVTQVLPRIGGGTGWVENQTWNGFLCRLLRSAWRSEPVHDRVIAMMTHAGFVVATGVSCWVAARRSPAGSSAPALAGAAFLAMMVLAVPAAWIHYETVTIPAFVLLAWASRERPLSPAAAAAVGLAFGLIAYGNQWTFYDGTPRPGLTSLGLSREFYGLVVLWAATLVTAQRAMADPVQC